MSKSARERFVFLFHDGFDVSTRAPHYDLMLESNGVLKTWALAEDPFQRSSAGHAKQNAKKLPDHRVMYLDYEGPVSDNRGTVSRVARGELNWIEFGDKKIIAELLFEESSDPTEQRSHFLNLVELVWSQDDQWTACFLENENAGRHQAGEGDDKK